MTPARQHNNTAGNQTGQQTARGSATDKRRGWPAPTQKGKCQAAWIRGSTREGLRGSNWPGWKTLEVVFPSLLVPVRRRHTLSGWWSTTANCSAGLPQGGTALVVFLSRSYRGPLCGHCSDITHWNCLYQSNTTRPTLAPSLAHAWDSTDRQSGPSLGRLACSTKCILSTCNRWIRNVDTPYL